MVAAGRDAPSAALRFLGGSIVCAGDGASARKGNRTQRHREADPFAWSGSIRDGAALSSAGTCTRLSVVAVDRSAARGCAEHPLAFDDADGRSLLVDRFAVTRKFDRFAVTRKFDRFAVTRKFDRFAVTRKFDRFAVTREFDCFAATHEFCGRWHGCSDENPHAGGGDIRGGDCRDGYSAALDHAPAEVPAMADRVLH